MSKPPTLEILIVTRAREGALPLYDRCRTLLEKNTIAGFEVGLFINNYTDFPLSGPSITSPANEGFLAPNNVLVRESLSEAPFVVLLNDDVEVGFGWDAPLVAALLHERVGAVGYSGAYLDLESMVGTKKACPGFGADYVEGWCLALRRETVQRVRSLRGGNLFDADNLSFAYGEDSDLCLFLAELGYQNLVLPDLDGKLIHHLGSQTSGAIQRAPGAEAQLLQACFARNHAYLQQRWRGFLQSKRLCNMGAPGEARQQ